VLEVSARGTDPAPRARGRSVASGSGRPRRAQLQAWAYRLGLLLCGALDVLGPGLGLSAGTASRSAPGTGASSPHACPSSGRSLGSVATPSSTASSSTLPADARTSRSRKQEAEEPATRTGS